MSRPSTGYVPQTHAEAASAWIRQVRPVARKRFVEGVLTAAPGLSAEQVKLITGHAEDFACQLLDACGFPEAAGEIRDLAAREREDSAGEDGAA